MKWKIKERKYPDIGSKRAKTRFAWVPEPTYDGYWVWLEKYLAMQEYVVTNEALNHMRWVTKESWSQKSTMWQEYEDKV